MYGSRYLHLTNEIQISLKNENEKEGCPPSVNHIAGGVAMVGDFQNSNFFVKIHVLSARMRK